MTRTPTVDPGGGPTGREDPDLCAIGTVTPPKGSTACTAQPPPQRQATTVGGCERHRHAPAFDSRRRRQLSRAAPGEFARRTTPMTRDRPWLWPGWLWLGRNEIGRES